MNLINIGGHLGGDAEIRYTSSGKKVTTLRVATRTRKGGTDDTIWWRVTLWGEQYDKMVPYLKKGSSVVVVGELQKPEIYNDREGKPQISMEITAVHIQFSPFGKSGGSQSNESGGSSHASGQQAPFGSHAEPAAAASHMAFPGASRGAGQPQGETFDDEVPF